MVRKTILITGATGFTGQHAIRYFEDKGYDVIGTSRKDGKDKRIKIDLTKREEVFSVIKNIKPDFVLHLAGQNAVEASWKAPLATFDVNVATTLHLLEAIRNHQPNAKTIVVGSALEDRIHDNSPSLHPYGVSKTLQRLIAIKWSDLFGLNIIVVKPTNLIGPGFSNGVCALFAEKIAKMEKQNQPIVLTITNPAIKRDFLDVRDAVKGYEMLLQKGKKGEIYEMGTGNCVSLGKIIEIYKKIADLSFTVDVQHKSTQMTVPLLNAEKLREIGWEPTIPLRESLFDCLNFYRLNC